MEKEVCIDPRLNQVGAWEDKGTWTLRTTTVRTSFFFSVIFPDTLCDITITPIDSLGNSSERLVLTAPNDLPHYNTKGREKDG